jgi:predicted O-methyltransferase YrrM
MPDKDHTVKYPSKTQRILKAITWLFTGNSAQKRRVHQEMARIAASFFGDFPIGDDHKRWLEDKEFRNTFKKLSPISPYSEERKWTLKNFAAYVHALPGSMAECGCYQGASAYFMAQENPDTPLHLFDSFEGLSQPEPIDSPDRNDERSWKKGDMQATEEITKDTLKKYQNIFFHKGWIPNQFHTVENETFKLVHIDVDLYQPTKDCLSFFYPRMVSNGVIVLDDYGSTLCPGAYKAVQEFTNEHDMPIIHLATMQGILFKR